MKQTERRAGGLATNGDTMKKLGVSLAIMIASGAAAHAADLPTTKGPAARSAELLRQHSGPGSNSTPADCPLSWGPFTVYATLDAGLTYEFERRPLQRGVE